MKIEWAVLSTEPMKVLLINIKILSNFPLWAAITQLAHNCRDVNMGFQKLETTTFDLMYVDNMHIIHKIEYLLIKHAIWQHRSLFCAHFWHFMQISNMQISKFYILTHADGKYNASPTIWYLTRYVYLGIGHLHATFCWNAHHMSLTPLPRLPGHCSIMAIVWHPKLAHLSCMISFFITTCIFPTNIM